MSIKLMDEGSEREREGGGGEGGIVLTMRSRRITFDLKFDRSSHR